MEERKVVKMVNCVMKIYDEVSLTDLEPGSLFSVIADGDNGVTELMGLKTEYGNNNGGIDSYFIGSGERISLDNRTATKTGCDGISVLPIEIVTLDDYNRYFDMWNKLRSKIEDDLKFHKSGEMQSIAEAIHGETKCENFLEYMREIEAEFNK